MFVKQISIFVENRSGSAADILEILAKENINICTLSIADTADYGIMRLIVDDPDRAKVLLQENGVMAKCTDVLAIPIPDQPGGLAGVLKILKEAGVAIDYMYAYVGHRQKNAVVLAKADDPDRALAALEEHGIIPFSAEQLW